MINAVEGLINAIKSGGLGIAVYKGFRSEYAERPVINRSVYVTAEVIKGGEVSFAIYVYVPKSMGGYECSSLACSVYNILCRRDYDMSNATVGSAYYDNDSQGFAVKISGSCNDNTLDYSPEIPSEVLPELLVLTVEGDSFDTFDINAESVKASYDRKSEPVYEVFNDAPLAYRSTWTECTVTAVTGDKSGLDFLVRNPCFVLKITETEEVVRNCVVQSLERNAEKERYTCVIKGVLED